MINEMSVFVGIGDIAKKCRPLASTVRLQILDGGYMAGIEAVQPDIFPPIKALSLIFDRKLGAINNFPSIKDSEFIDQIIEGRSEIVADFTNDDTNLNGKCWDAMHNELRFAEGVRVSTPFPRAGIFLVLPDSVDPCYKIKNVFACPGCASVGAH